MALEGFQKDVDEWTGQFDPQYFSPEKIVCQMVEEVGEISKVVSYLQKTKKIKEGEEKGDLGQELVDLLFAISCMANSHSIDLNEEWERMMKEKRYGRDQNRFDKK